MQHKKRRSIVAAIIVLLIFGLGVFSESSQNPANVELKNAVSEAPMGSVVASEALENLDVKGRAPKTGYDREQFMNDWGNVDGCDMRNIILKRDMTEVRLAENRCIVLSGILIGPYTANKISFNRGSSSSRAVQIDHVVALSDAWQKGAQGLSYEKRNEFANDPLNLLAVDGPTNQNKGDSDSASWLPANKGYRCAYIARQVAVKSKYNLWVTQAEHDAMSRILKACPRQVLPVNG